METKSKITQYREKLDKTLVCHDLSNEDEIRKLVKKKLIDSSQYGAGEYLDSTLDKRTEEVTNFLDMLRSASMNGDDSKTREASHAHWKLKQDNDEFRVMYREGPPGTPFHMLLVEGYVDGPVDSCLCVSWETMLYKKWWPQYNVPAFKIMSSQCLQKVRIGEQVSVMRVKVSWPLSAREALLHYFEFEYFQDDLIVVLINTISDLENANEDTIGITKDKIPDPEGMVRIDLVGGFAIQKVTPERSYFRTIASIDMKLDFVPPSLINFISRQLIGSGFKLYQKAVASVAKRDEDFNNALEDSMYSRIREALYSKDKMNKVSEPDDLSNDAFIFEENNFIEIVQNSVRVTGEIFLEPVNTTEFSQEDSTVIDMKAVSEIEEEEIEEIKEEKIEENMIEEEKIKEKMIEEEIEENMIEKEESEKDMIEEDVSEENMIEEEENEQDILLDKEDGRINTNKKVCIRPEVEQALETLQKVISVARDLSINTQIKSFGFANNEHQNIREDVGEGFSEENESSSEDLVNDGSSKEKAVERASDEPRNSFSVHIPTNTRSNSYPREINHNKVAPASPERKTEIPAVTNQVTTIHSSINGKLVDGKLSDEAANNNEQIITDNNGIHENNLEQRKKSSRQKKNRFCFCLHYVSGNW